VNEARDSEFSYGPDVNEQVHAKRLDETASRLIVAGALAAAFVLMAGALYLIAVRGDVLLEDLSRIAALLCG